MQYSTGGLGSFDFRVLGAIPNGLSQTTIIFLPAGDEIKTGQVHPSSTGHLQNGKTEIGFVVYPTSVFLSRYLSCTVQMIWVQFFLSFVLKRIVTQGTNVSPQSRSSYFLNCPASGSGWKGCLNLHPSELFHPNLCIVAIKKIPALIWMRLSRGIGREGWQSQNSWQVTYRRNSSNGHKQKTSPLYIPMIKGINTELSQVIICLVLPLNTVPIRRLIISIVIKSVLRLYYMKSKVSGVAFQFISCVT